MRASGDVVRSLQEVIADAAVSGASLHVVHLNSAAMRKTPEALRMVDGARLHGLDVTTEAYPYVAGATRLESALFDPGWQQRQHIDYSDLLWPATGERLNPALFERYRKQGGTVVLFSNTEEMIRLILAHPLVMVASDGILENGVGHPRAAGTYARLLGKYVREEKVLTLMEAIRKSSLLPAHAPAGLLARRCARKAALRSVPTPTWRSSIPTPSSTKPPTKNLRSIPKASALFWSAEHS